MSGLETVTSEGKCQERHFQDWEGLAFLGGSEYTGIVFHTFGGDSLETMD